MMNSDASHYELVLAAANPNDLDASLKPLQSNLTESAQR